MEKLSYNSGRHRCQPHNHLWEVWGLSGWQLWAETRYKGRPGCLFPVRLVSTEDDQDSPGLFPPLLPRLRQPRPCRGHRGRGEGRQGPVGGPIRLQGVRGVRRVRSPGLPWRPLDRDDQGPGHQPDQRHPGDQTDLPVMNSRDAGRVNTRSSMSYSFLMASARIMENKESSTVMRAQWEESFMTY